MSKFAYDSHGTEYELPFTAGDCVGHGNPLGPCQGEVEMRGTGAEHNVFPWCDRHDTLNEHTLAKFGRRGAYRD